MKKSESGLSIETKYVKKLDELIEILDQDQLRNVAGGLRPKGGHIRKK